MLFSLVLTACFVVGNVSSFAAAAADPVIGTWTLNAANSKYNPGPAPKSLTRTYTANAKGVTLMLSGVAADGSPISGQSTFKYDGKDYPFTGSANYDSISIKKVNGTTAKSSLKKDGKIVGTTTRSVSAHGKVLTLATKITDSKGVKHDEVAVYDKQ
jgi:hypothetical protein